MALNYERIGWENAPSTNTPIDAGSLNHMDNGILAVSNLYDVDVPYLKEQVAGIPAMLDSYLADQIGVDVGKWLDDHVTPGGSTIVVDDTLTISGAAADSKTVGDALAAKADAEDLDEAVGDISQLKNALTTKAEQDGVYPDLTAGQLLSKIESADSVPYNFRAVGHEATLEYTDAIVGGSVVKNQLVRNGDFADSSNWAGSGSLSISGGIATYTAAGRYDGPYQVFPVTHSKGRVYFMHTKLKTSTATDQIQFILQGAGTASSKYSASTTNWQTLETIDKPGLDFERVTVRDNRADIHDSYQITDIYVIDLTTMLGTTLADYIYSLEQANAGAGVAWLRKHFPKLFTYQPYNAGEIVSVQGLSQHITRDADNNIIGTYPLDGTKTFRGIFKLDSNNQLYADGDRYLPDGTVGRRYGERAYQSGDVTDGSTMITDGTNTVYKLTTPTTEEADPYTVPQIVDPDGTEEYVSTSIVPVGHESRYPLDIAGRLDKILTMPTANGTYTLRATVNNGAVTYAWVST